MDRARELNVGPEVLVAIRRKIYEEQDAIIALLSKNNIEVKDSFLTPPKKNYWLKRD